MAEASPVLQQSSGLLTTDGSLSPDQQRQRQAERAALIMMLMGQGQAQRPVPPAPMPSILAPRERSDRPGRPRVGGGDVGALLSVMGGPAAVPGIIGSFVASDAMGRDPDPSLLSAPGMVRLIAERSNDRPDRGRVSRPDRVRSASNREAGGGFTA